MRLVLDAGALTMLAGRTGRARVQALRDRGLWPPLIPSVACVEALTGHPGRDAATNQILKACEVVECLEMRIARRAVSLRFARADDRQSTPSSSPWASNTAMSSS
jgi:hypothetical protein